MKKIKEYFQRLSKNKYSIVLVFLFLSILPVLSLFHPGLPITHDGQDHVARIANFYLNLTEGNLIPRWAANLNWGYGHPILEFLYPFPSYIASFFHFVGFALVDATKLVFVLGMVLSSIFMYLWLSQFSSKHAALFGAVLYTYAPYRFVETYVRGDIGENLAFAFVPLVLFFLHKLYKKNEYKSLVLGSISLAFLILSHNAISLMFVPFILIYGFILLYLSRNPKAYFITFTSLILLGFGLAAFFWIPALLEGKYTLRNIVTKGGYITNFVSFKNLIYSPWNYGITGEFTVQFGPFQWLAILLSPFTILRFKKIKEKYLLSVILLIVTVLAVFLMLPVSNFIWSRIILLQNFQFPWRFLAIVVFSTAVLATLLIDAIFKIINTKLLVLFSVSTILVISSFYWQPKGYQYKQESFYKSVYESTTDTGESAPIWSVRFMEKRPKAHLEVIDGDASIREFRRASTYHKYQIVVNKKTLFEENTLYFPGWEIKANNIPVNIQFQNKDYMGVMLFFLDKGNYVVEAKYSETKLRIISDIISFVSLFIILCFVGIKFTKYKLN